jgi:two-component system LytT family response regulator
MLKALIVDDEQRSRLTLEKMLSNYCPNVEVVDQASHVDEALEKLQQYPEIQLVFLDIEMPGKSGFELLNTYENPHFQVIFTTAYDQFALKAIRLSALDYLLKPINIKELIAAVNKAEKYFQSEAYAQSYHQLIQHLRNPNKPNPKIGLPTNDGLIFLTVDQIIRCQAEGNYTKIVYNESREILASRKLREFEAMLESYNFCRVHNSHLINLSHIMEYKRGDGGIAIMGDGSEIGISRRRKDEFLEKLNRI